ncbi:MAG TPA: hemolysin [Flavobacteriales bacterium]|nr:hemolysin [Flavobacteriales bacterium]
MEYVLIGIVCSLLLSAFFSGMEIAIVSSSRLELELDVKKGIFLSKYISKLIKKSWRIIGAMLVGNNIALVMYGIYMTKWLDPFLLPFIRSEMLLLFTETLISTIIVLFLAEFLPKAIFSLNPYRALNFFKIPLILAYYVLYLPTILIIGLSEKLIKVFMKVDIGDESFNFGIVDLNHYLDSLSKTESRLEEVDNEFLFLTNALEFSSIKARECMIPRNEIEAVEIEEAGEQLLKSFIETGLSKIPIYRGNIDNIIGYMHSATMFEPSDHIMEHLKPVMIIPESMTANNILKNFISARTNMAVVVDEFGGTSGILTREDLLEEIFGEIEDEHDLEDLVEKKLDTNRYEFSARLEIDYINETYGLSIPESDDYETLAGFILSHTESIPRVRETVKIGSLRIQILKVSENRIEQVLISLIEQE